NRGINRKRIVALSESSACQPSLGIAALLLPLTQTVTEPIGCYNEKYLVGGLPMPVNPEIGFFLRKAIRPEFAKSRFYIVDLKETSILCWIASVLGESDLNSISTKDRGLKRRIPA